MVLSLEGGVANIANEPTFNCVLDDVLFHQVTFGQRHLAFGAAVEECAVKRGLFADLTGLEIEFSEI